MKITKIAILTATLCLFGAAYADSDDDSDADGKKFVTTGTGDQEVVFDVAGNFIPGGRDTEAVVRARARFDAGLTKVEVNVRLKGLIGTFLAAHFHCGRPGQNGPVAFGLVNPGPLFPDGNRIRGTLDNLAFNGADCTAIVGRPVNNIAALAFAMKEGLIYLNIHTTTFPGGEARGQMTSHKH